jgi:uncharacterized protein (DUF433 family)
MKQTIISRSPDVMGGTAVFSGTLVPVQTLLDYFEAGETVDAFLEGFPSVTREQVIALGTGHRSSDRSSLVTVLLDECVDWRLNPTAERGKE